MHSRIFQLLRSRAPRFVQFELALDFCQSPWWTLVTPLQDALKRQRQEQGNPFTAVPSGGCILILEVLVLKAPLKPLQNTVKTSFHLLHISQHFTGSAAVSVVIIYDGYLI